MSPREVTTYTILKQLIFCLYADEYHEALKLGEVVLAYARVMMIGTSGVENSSLLKGLVNLELPLDTDNTILADTNIVKPHVWARARQSTDNHWKEVTDYDEIQKVAGLVHLVALAKSRMANPSFAAKILSSITSWIWYLLGRMPDEVIHEEYMSSIKDTVLRDILMQALESTNPTSESLAATESEVLIDLWDCGSQPVFLDVLPTSRTVFLLIFDARLNLVNKCEMICPKEGRVVSTTEEGFTVLQLLTQWMTCIYATPTSQNLVASNPEVSSFTPQSGKPLAIEDKETDNSQRTQSLPAHTEEKSTQGNTEGNTFLNFPCIIPVGTHDDDLGLEGKEILDTLRSHCVDKAFSPLLLDGVIVNTTTAGKQDEDPGFTYIRNKVNHFATENLTIPTPVTWVLFQKLLQKVAKGKSCPVVSYQQAVAVGAACEIPENAVPSVLHFYHELSVFLHYAQIKSFSHSIITDPQWLIKQLGKLLPPDGFQLEVPNPFIWKPLRENGILVQPLYEALWKGSNPSPQSLVDLLEHFGLAALVDSQRILTPFPGREYFVPSVLQFSPQTADSTTKVVKKSSPLQLTFSTWYVPPGFFIRLATTLSKESNCCLLFKRGVFRNMMTFAYGFVDTIDEFTIIEHSSSVQITVVRTEYRQPHIPTFASVCHDVMKLIQACSITIRQWYPSLKVQVAFHCQRCPNKDHFMHIPPSATTCSILRCQDGRKSSLTMEQQYWMKVANIPKVCYLSNLVLHNNNQYFSWHVDHCRNGWPQ